MQRVNVCILAEEKLSETDAAKTHFYRASLKVLRYRVKIGKTVFSFLAGEF